METGNAWVENSLYENIDSTRSGLPAGYPTDTYTDPNEYVAKLNASTGKKIGPAILLKVMAGDSVNIRCSSWYRLNGTTPGDPASPLTDLLVNLAKGITSVSGLKYTQPQLSNTLLPPGITDLLNDRSTGFNSSRPKAYLSWVLLDEQFHYVSGSSGFEQVGADTVLTTWVKTALPMSKNGYLYVYTGNESEINVYFDNLQVSHVRGPLLEETHYYPFGLTMAGISSKAAGKLENKKNKFQGQEFNDDLGVDMYEFKYRMDDPQIGRFWQVDPLSDKYVHNSIYAFSENRVTGHVELEGLEAVEANSVMYSQNGKSKVLHYSASKVDNPYNLGGGTLNNVTLVEVDNNGKQSIRTTHIYEPTFLQKVLNFFDFGQVQVYGSGDGSESPGSEPDYSKPIKSVNFDEIAPLLDLIKSGGKAKQDYHSPSLDEFPDYAKNLVDKVTDGTKAHGSSMHSSQGQDDNKSSSNSSKGSSTKKTSVKYFYDGTPANGQKGNGSGLRTSTDPKKPDTILYDKPTK
ncbi:RHS repeat-associated core domain-containing protein [Sediminibacterium soli]|uniref:RHS repeat-associated core domain-containing protein n=1 Tax=Sediminibacterium soli TaxID=2698829 RepID=UPI00137B7720|nr:RHS repeat-associated core domain-containing protein [Sediminibacterium soli]NCI45799.1 hypothetical protein [Sediminibacterium soli]